jgi:hypothetical protein
VHFPVYRHVRSDDGGPLGHAIVFQLMLSAFWVDPLPDMVYRASWPEIGRYPCHNITWKPILTLREAM